MAGPPWPRQGHPLAVRAETCPPAVRAGTAPSRWRDRTDSPNLELWADCFHLEAGREPTCFGREASGNHEPRILHK